MHIIQHHPVSQQVELWRLALFVKVKQSFVPLAQHLLIGLNPLIFELFNIGNAKVDALAKGKEFGDFVLLFQHLTKSQAEHQIIRFHLFGDGIGHFHIGLTFIIETCFGFLANRINLHIVNALDN